MCNVLSAVSFSITQVLSSPRSHCTKNEALSLPLSLGRTCTHLPHVTPASVKLDPVVCDFVLKVSAPVLCHRCLVAPQLVLTVEIDALIHESAADTDVSLHFSQFVGNSLKGEGKEEEGRGGRDKWVRKLYQNAGKSHHITSHHITSHHITKQGQIGRLVSPEGRSAFP